MKSIERLIAVAAEQEEGESVEVALIHDWMGLQRDLQQRGVLPADIEFTLVRAGEVLTPVEHRLLVTLRNAKGRFVRTSEMVRSGGIKAKTNDGSMSLWVHICRLRNKLTSGIEIVVARERGYALMQIDGADIGKPPASLSAT